MARKKGESEAVAGSGSEVPVPASGIGTRISEISRRAGGKKKLAAKAHVSESHLYRYISGESEPTASRLVALARAADVSIAWLATGEGEAFPAAQTATAAVDLDRLEEVVAKTRAKFKERGINLTPQSEAKVIRMIYEFYTRQGVPMDEASLENVIELAAFR